MTLKLGIQHLVLEYYQCFHMVTLGWPWPFLWQGQICFWMLLHGWKLIQHWVLMYFQVCSNLAYPPHSVERYRTNSPLVLSFCVSICFHRIRHNEGIYRNIKKWKCHHVFSSKNLQQYFPQVSHTLPPTSGNSTSHNPNLILVIEPWTSNYGTGIVFIGNMLSWLSFHNFVWWSLNAHISIISPNIWDLISKSNSSIYYR